MDIKECLIPKASKARCGWAMTPRFITIHNTGNASGTATAANHAKYMTSSGKDKEVSYHYVVDDKEIYRLIPDNEVAWHAGDGAKGIGNRQSIAVEICENHGGDLKKATDNGAQLTAYLMKKHNIPISNVVQHNYWRGKDCPARIRRGEPYGWTAFVKKVIGETSEEEQLKQEIAALKGVLLEIENLVEGVNV